MKNAAKTKQAPQAQASFPGGRGVVPDAGELRIVVDKKPYAEIIGHAVLEPDVEVCGVLVGRKLEDAQGPFLVISQAIRGEAAKQEGAQVTFTHETWNHIHREMDQKYPDQEIVGWYHTHGGFGIFLSEMDTFIHRNFFSQPHQVAYVYDPLAGTEGFFHGLSGELRQARRYWLGGRERTPLGAAVAAAPAAAGQPEEVGLAGAVVALTRAATALQVSVQRPAAEPLPSWVLGLGAALVLLVGYSLLSGTLPRLGAGERRSEHMLLLQQDPVSGQALGLEVVPLQRDRDGAFQDATGQRHLGVELGGPDGARLLEELTRAGAPRPAPEAPAPEAQPPPRGGRAKAVPLTQVLLAVGAVVVALAVGGLAFALRRGRKHGS
ncbi:MAG TPA: Mov34/MPN/PAD-1 family protein [Aggregicoccus sp.]|nr:Mov34/MPN/PAD-1 family protein [Aggregicoccus sp.]